MNDSRFERLEDRVEKIDDKVDNIREDIAELKGDMKLFSSKIERHVAGDEKIINAVMPTLHQFKLFVENDLGAIKDIVKMEEARQINEKLKAEKKKKLQTNLAIISTIASIIGGIVYKLVQMGLVKF